jgi:hypothetical protein
MVRSFQFSAFLSEIFGSNFMAARYCYETATKKVAGARCCQPELLESPALGKAS